MVFFFFKKNSNINYYYQLENYNLYPIIYLKTFLKLTSFNGLIVKFIIFELIENKIIFLKIDLKLN